MCTSPETKRFVPIAAREHFRKHRRVLGFTLLETFVALVILGFALAGLSMLMLGNMQTGLGARRNTAAGALAQHKLEELRAGGYAAAASSTISDELVTLSEAGATSGVRPFTRSWTVTPGTGAAAGTKALSVVVSWTDQFGSQQVQLQSILAN